MRLQDKVAIVTGAASGIGKDIARRFAEEGARVVAVDRNAAENAATATAIKAAGFDAIALTADVTKPADVESAVQQTIEQFGWIDVLSCSAGLDQHIVPISEMDVELWDRIMAVNAKGLFLCARYVLPYMRAARRGSIVLTASDLGFVAIPGLGAYCSSKGAALQLTRVLAAENGPFNIRVNALCPTMIDTPMARRTLDTHPDPEGWLKGLSADIPLGRIGRVEEVSAAAVFLASDEAAYITGACLPVDGGRTVL